MFWCALPARCGRDAAWPGSRRRGWRASRPACRAAPCRSPGPAPVRSRWRSAARIAVVGVHAGEQVGDRDADLLRPAAGCVVGDLAPRRAGDAHQAAHALDRVVVAGAVAVGPGLAEAGDRAVDEARVQRAAARRVEAVAGHVADLEVLDEDVGLRGHPADQRLALGVGDVDRDRALVAVRAEVVGGLGGLARRRRRAGTAVPSRACRRRRDDSSRVGRSTLITSAPRSASVCVHQGPASTRERSSTRTPASA